MVKEYFRKTKKKIFFFKFLEQLRIFRVSFNRICQREECIRIWKQIARELSLTNEDIEHIEQQYSSKEERCLRCLEQWALNDPRGDITHLARIMRSFGFKTLARMYMNLIEFISNLNDFILGEIESMG